MATAATEIASTFIKVAVIPSMKGVQKDIQRQMQSSLQGATKAVAKQMGDTVSKTVQRGMVTGMQRGMVSGSRSVNVSRMSGLQSVARGISGAIGGAAMAGWRTFSNIGTAAVTGISGAVAGLASIARRSLSGVGNAIGDAISGPIAFASAAMATLGVITLKTGVSYNTLQQTSRGALSTLLGSTEAANAQMDKLDGFVKGSPYGKAYFIKAQQQLLAFGFSAEQVIPTLSAVQDTVAAMGGGNNEIVELSTLLAKIRSTQRLDFIDLQQLANYGIDAATIIGDTMGKTGAQVREMMRKESITGQNAINALGHVINGMAEKNAGASENIKKTFQGVVDSIAGAFRDLSSAIIEPFINAKKPAGIFIEWGGIISKIFRGLIPVVEAFYKVFDKEFGAGVKRVTQWLTNLLDKVNNIDLGMVKTWKKEWKEVRSEAGTGIGAVLGFISMKVSSFLPIIGRLAPAIHPLMGALLGSIAAGGKWSIFTELLGRMWTQIKRIAGILQGPMSSGANKFSDIFLDGLRSIVEWMERLDKKTILVFIERIKQTWAKFKPFFTKVGDGFKKMKARADKAFTWEKFDQFTDKVKTWLEKYLPVVVFFALQFAKGPLGAIPIFGALLTKINPVVGGIGALIANNEELRDKFSSLWETLKKFWEDNEEGITNLIDLFLELITDCLEVIIPIVEDILKWIQENETAAKNWAIAIGSVWVAAKGIYGTMKLIQGLKAFGALFGLGAAAGGDGPIIVGGGKKGGKPKAPGGSKMPKWLGRLLGGVGIGAGAAGAGKGAAAAGAGAAARTPMGAIAAGAAAAGMVITLGFTELAHAIAGTNDKTGTNTIDRYTSQPIIDQIKGGWEVYGELGHEFSLIWDGWVKRMGRDMTKVSDALDNVGNWFSDRWRDLRTGWNWDTVKNNVSEFGDSLKNGFNWLTKLNPMNLTRVPGYAKGGTVAPSPGGSLIRVAEAGRAETIVDTASLNALVNEFRRINNSGGYSGNNTNKAPITIEVGGITVPGGGTYEENVRAGRTIAKTLKRRMQDPNLFNSFA